MTIRKLCLFYKSRSNLLLTGLMALALAGAGCASAPSYEVTVFHDWSDSAPRRFQLAPPDDPASIKERTYRKNVSDALIQAGFELTQDAPLVVDFDYAVNKREVRYVDPAPLYLYPHFSAGYHGSHLGLSLHAPLWWRYDDRVRIQTVNEHVLELKFSDTRAGEPMRIVESSVSRQTLPEVSNILTELMKAALTDFPGESGRTRRVTVAPASQ